MILAREPDGCWGDEAPPAAGIVAACSGAVPRVESSDAALNPMSFQDGSSLLDARPEFSDGRANDGDREVDEGCDDAMVPRIDARLPPRRDAAVVRHSAARRDAALCGEAAARKDAAGAVGDARVARHRVRPDSGAAPCSAADGSWVDPSPLGPTCSGQLLQSAGGLSATAMTLGDDLVGPATFRCDRGTSVASAGRATRGPRRGSCQRGASAATGGEFVRLFAALVDRAPEPAGLQYWNDRGVSEAKVGAFANGEEARRVYGQPATAQQVVERFRRTACARAADPVCMAFWVGGLLAGTHATSGGGMGRFVRSLLGAAGGTDRQAPSKCERAAGRFVEQWVQRRCPWDALGMTVLQAVDGQSDVQAIERSIDASMVQWEREVIRGLQAAALVCR